MQKKVSSYNLGGNANDEATMEKAPRFLETLNTEITNDPAIPFPGLDTEKITIQDDTCTSIFRAALFTMAKT